MSTQRFSREFEPHHPINHQRKRRCMSSKIATKGTKTTTGGEILEGLPNITFGGQPAATVGMMASCKSGRSTCKGIGKIVQIGDHVLILSNGQKAVLQDYQVLCNCSDNFICAPSHNITAAPNGGSVHLGPNVHIGENVHFGGANPYTEPQKYRNPNLERQLDIYAEVEKKHAAKKAAQLVGQVSQTGVKKISQELADSLSLECTLEDALNDNHQQTLILDELDSHILLHNIWIDMGRNTAALAMYINSAKSWGNHIDPIFDAASLVKQFGDVKITASLVQNKGGKNCIAFAGSKNGEALRHALVNGVRINMERKYPLNSLKAIQTGFSPTVRLANFKGAAALTFIISASIATTDLVFKDDYHFVDWFGSVGSDMFKALAQYGAGEVALFALATFNAPILAGALFVAFAYIGIEIIWSHYKLSNEIIAVSKDIVRELENAIGN